MTKGAVLTWVLTPCAGAYKSGSQGVPAQRCSLAANALASWNGSGGGSQAGASSAAASAVDQVMPHASSPYSSNTADIQAIARADRACQRIPSYSACCCVHPVHTAFPCYVKDM